MRRSAAGENRFGTGGRPVPRSRQAITYGSRYYIEIHFNLVWGFHVGGQAASRPR